MTANALRDIVKIEASLGEAADQLRADSKPRSSDYSMPVLEAISCAMPLATSSSPA